MNNTYRFMKKYHETVEYSYDGYYGSGKVNLYQKDLKTGKQNFTDSYSRRNPVNLIKYINPRTENWYTANSVSDRNRSYAKVTGFNMLFCDIDSIGLAGVSPEETYQKVLDCLNDDLILTPTAVIASGHGIHLIYLFKQQIPNHNDKIKEYWEKTEIANLRLISKYIKGVDWKVKDPNRILRMPSSNNTKDYAKSDDKRDLKPVKILKLTDQKYDFWTLCESMVEQLEHAERVAKYKAWKKQAEQKNSLNTYKQLKVFSYQGLDKRSLNLAHRIKSVIKLVSVRKGHLDHYRNTLLHIIGSGWLYVNRGAKHASPDTQLDIKMYTWKLIKKVNQMFVVPKRKAVMARFKSRIMASKFNISHKGNDFGKYCYSKKGIIKVLHITPKEQWDLKYLRTRKVEQEHLAYVRQMNRYNTKAARAYAWNEKRLQEVQKRTKFVHKLLKYRKQGYTYRQIASMYTYSLSYIYNLIHDYRYLAKHYGSHKYDKAMSVLSDLVSIEASMNYVPDILNLTMSEMNKIRGSA